MFVPKLLLAVAAVVAPTALAQTEDASLASYGAAWSAKEPLFGELECNNKTVYTIATRMFAEAQTIWKSRGWTVLSNSSGILNEAKPVSGVFASANVNITRVRAVVDAPAQTLFDYLITPKGYQLIDPTSNPEDFSKPPLETYSTSPWRRSAPVDKKRLDISRTEAVLGAGLTTREYLVLNAIDQTTRLFVSKSVQHRGDPGCSIYGPASCNALSTNPVRALNTFAVQVEPVKGDASKSVVRLINYADFTKPEIPAALMNQIVSVFLVDMVGRMRAYYAPTVAPTPAPSASVVSA